MEKEQEKRKNKINNLNIKMELEQILSNAAKHMSKEGQQRINNSTRNINRNQLINEDYCDSMNYTTQFPQQQTMEYRQPKQTQSKLPREIVESMLKTPINDYTNEFNTNTSVLDSLNIPKQTQNVNIIQEQIHSTTTICTTTSCTIPTTTINGRH